MSDRCPISVFRPGDHAMHIYNDDKERVMPILSYIDSIGESESVLYLTDRPSALTGRSVTEAGRERIHSALDSGRLKILPSKSSYCGGGGFDPYWMMENWAEVTASIADDNRRVSVIMGEEEWLSRDPRDFGKFMEYESLMNLSEAMRGYAILCQYSGELFREDQLDWARSVHCLVLNGERLERNYWILSRFHDPAGVRLR